MSIEQIKCKRVFLRVDFNVPIRNLKIQDGTRVVEALPTLRLLKQNQNKVVICSHLGQPDLSQEIESESNNELSFKHYVEELEDLLGFRIKLINDYFGSDLKICTESQKEDEVCLLENSRFHKEEENCDMAFSQKLAENFDVFVFDAFAVAHRKHASTFGVGQFLESYKGLLVQKETSSLDLAFNNSQKPLVLIVGGAKISTKIGVIENFLDRADFICIGGALANTFLYALGYELGESLVEKDSLEVAIEIINKSKKGKTELILPVDVVVQNGTCKSVMDVSKTDKALDIGNLTIARFENILRSSKTIIFNGPMGVFKENEFSEGTESVLNTIADLPESITILGGGDTLDALRKYAIDPECFTLVSTGGGAMLKYLEKGRLEVIDNISN